MGYDKRVDGRTMHEGRKMEAKVGVVKNADGSAMFRFGDTIAVAAVYGPKMLHPQHLQNPEKGIIRCNYDMLSFSGKLVYSEFDMFWQHNEFLSKQDKVIHNPNKTFLL